MEKDCGPARATPTPDAREYHIDLDVTVGDDRALHISAATNYPDGAMLHVSAGRSYYERDQPDAYWGEYESRDIAVKDGHISATVVADDNIWYDAYQRSAREFAGLILYSGIDRQTISGMVTVRVLFSPARSQPADVLARIRRDGKASSYTVE